ncbi:hypothetical protein L208DRAFT_1274633 [Tricholoma matsutake]|nr:hypothetical protein L208DRAFT_1274633 [Tricholoma matsutake 945]
MYEKYHAKMYGFCSRGLWVIGFQKVLGYGSKSPAYQPGHSRILWGIREYGLLEVWCKGTRGD